MADQPPLSSVGIMDMPTDVIERVMKHILGPSVPGVLDDQSLPMAKYLYAFCSTNTHFYKLFRQFQKSVHSLFLSRNIRFDVAILARLFGPSLRHLSIQWAPIMFQSEEYCDLGAETFLGLPKTDEGWAKFEERQKYYPDAAIFLKSLAEQRPSLWTLSLAVNFETHYDEIDFDKIPAFPIDGLVRVIKSSSKTLHHLGLGTRTIDYNDLAQRIAPHLTNLLSLALSDSNSLSFNHLRHILRSVGSKLRRLYLACLWHSSLDGNILELIAETCTGLKHLDMADFSLSAAIGLERAGSLLGSRLNHLNIPGTVTDIDEQRVFFGNLESHCTSLAHLNLWLNDEDPLGTIDAAKHVCFRLRSLRLEGLGVNYTSEIISRLKMNLPGLLDLYLETATPAATVSFIEHFGPHLRILHIQGHVNPSDFFLTSYPLAQSFVT